MTNENSFSEYERKAKEIRDTNKEYLNGFEDHLKAQGLSIKTINNHRLNVDFYINSFLLYYDALDVSYGCYKVDGFLGDWFIRKAMWSSVGNIKSNISSFKKFYRYLLGIGVVDEEAYDKLCETIALNKDDWFDLMRRYDDPEEENPFIMFY